MHIPTDLTESEMQRLDRIARCYQVSRAEVVRRAVKAFADEAELRVAQPELATCESPTN